MNTRQKIKHWLYGSCPGFAGSFPYFGTKIYFPKDSHLFNEACKQGIFEQEIVSAIETLIIPDTFYFDIGSNIGLMAAPFLQTIPSCRVMSFEPSPNTFPFLKRTQKSSPFRDRWIIVTKAVSNYIGEEEFTMNTAGMGPFDGLKNTKRTTSASSVRVQVTTLDTEWELIGRPRVSVIKCDVEGGELNVFKGALQCINVNRPFILTEWNLINLMAYNCAYSNLLSFANSIGYVVYSLPSLVRIMDVRSEE